MDFVQGMEFSMDKFKSSLYPIFLKQKGVRLGQLKKFVLTEGSLHRGFVITEFDCST